MKYRVLGRTGISVSVLGFGAGPISTLLVGDDEARQRAVVAKALEVGINWFDTAATYGQGKSEQNLGRLLEELSAHDRAQIATKVRIMPDEDIPTAIERSVDASLHRLRRSQVTLLQLHNSITARRGDEPTSLTPDDVLGKRGVLETFLKLQQDGRVLHLGLTGIGQPNSLREVIRTGNFATLQVPYHLLNPSAGLEVVCEFGDVNYGNIIADCASQAMGVFAIRVLAGGALADNAPSPHTYKTPFFPLELYQRDRQGAARLQARIGSDRHLPTEAIRFAVAHPAIHSALIGFGETWQIDQALGIFSSAQPALTWDDVLASTRDDPS